MRLTYEFRLAHALLNEDKLGPFDLIIGHEQGYGLTRRLNL